MPSVDVIKRVEAIIEELESCRIDHNRICDDCYITANKLREAINWSR